jgi:predicted glycogen debranching enzyme
MRFDEATDLDRLVNLEWLETNGLGGFASSSLAGMNTRRYHGLLTAATHPPVGRMVLLSKLEETLIIGGKRFELSCNQYPGAIYPSGFKYLREFRQHPFPTFVYELGQLRIEKRVFMIYGENTTVIEYCIEPNENQSGVFFELRPLIAFRDYHLLTHRNDTLSEEVDEISGGVMVHPYPDLPALYVTYDAAKVQITSDWYNNFEYRVEQERGLDFREDLFNPFSLRFDLQDVPSVAVIASLEPHRMSELPSLRERELERRNSIRTLVPGASPFVQRLAAAADQFIVKRGDLQTVIAGYHWFSDWGRDTMIALPGLTLVTGRFDVTRNILKAFAQSVDQGMLPNRWPDAGEQPEYNTVDATLWFFEAIAAFLRYTDDYDFVCAQLLQVMASIIDWHIRGTRFGIKVNHRALLNCGEPGSQLTWMDAKVDGKPITPRQGMPVEIQALWYNALRIMQGLAIKLKDDSAERLYRELADQAQANFNAIFWNEDAGCLFDVIDGDKKDSSIRPNQILALSLTHPIFGGSKADKILETVERELLTSRGLRTLAPSSPAYRAYYRGGVPERDSSYHQGTVWPWLLGPFVTAYVRHHGSSGAARKQAQKWLTGIEDHLDEACIGQISEIFDAVEPHTARGCVAQAWSVGEILRATVEDVLGSTPQAQEASDVGRECSSDLSVLTA